MVGRHNQTFCRPCNMPSRTKVPKRHYIEVSVGPYAHLALERGGAVKTREFRPTPLCSLCRDLKALSGPRNSPNMEHKRGLPVILEWCMAMLAMKNGHQGLFLFLEHRRHVAT